MLNVLASVTDKQGLDTFLSELQEFDELTVFATRSTADYLRNKGMACERVEDLTGFPEILGGRVKTLHPKVFAGILSRPSREDMDTLEDIGAPALDLVIVNLYAFEAAMSKGLSQDEMVEEIDIGGVALIRAAAKNFERVAVICSTEQYTRVVRQFRKDGGKFTKELRRMLSQEALQHTSHYDHTISAYLKDMTADTDAEPKTHITSASESIQLRKHSDLRYGENPHQSAAWFMPFRSYKDPFPPFEQLQGKELSANNITDTFALVTILRELQKPACCIIKHNNPCGVALGKTVHEAFDRAYNCDPLSAFGGVYGFTEPVDAALAQQINKGFVEIVLAPDFDAAAMDIFSQKKNLRVLKVRKGLLDAPVSADRIVDLKDFGVLVQSDAEPAVKAEQFKCMTAKKMDPDYLKDVDFAWSVVKHLTSNAIFVARHGCLLGSGIGQTSRVASVEIALKQAGSNANGAVLASDAFFPATDNIELAAKAGIGVIIQPGGSLKDEEVIAACDRAGIVMLFTGQRCFKH
jgi:phosphoribosylaminoimidazolecarboxamide formyltransferase / IMP cyclohydrolase